MKTQTLILLVTPIIFAAQISLSEAPNIPIVNIHESVESVAEIVKLKNVMAKLGMANVVLQGIPEDLLDFNHSATTEQSITDLSEVEENNAILKQALETFPEQFSYFCSLDPADSKRLALLEECLESGAIGVKLYNGYSYAHELALDDARLYDFYTILTAREVLLMLPVNTTYYESELRNILILNPNLSVICPHFCLSSKDLPRLNTLLNDFPNLYIDTSFGNLEFVKEGFTTISENRENYQTFFHTYQDRILFGTDAVLTSYEDKSMDWLTELYSDYIALFSEAEFESALLQASYRGLELPSSILRKVFYKNWLSLSQ